MRRFIFIFIFICAINAQQVQIQLDISHDIAPPPNFHSYSVTFTNTKTQVRYLMVSNKKIPVATYDISIAQPGYHAIKLKKQHVSSPAFLLKEKLIAKQRRISFEPEHYGIRFSGFIRDVINMKNNQKVIYYDTFAVKQPFHVKILFGKCKTIEIKDIMPVGEGAYVVEIPIIPLKWQDFAIRKDKAVIDQISYEYEFVIDGKPLEAHHIKKEQGRGRFYYTIMREKNATLFRAYLGYKYSEIPMKKFRQGMNVYRPDHLSIIRFIVHLQKVYSIKHDYKVLARIVEHLLKGYRHRKMLKKCSEEDIAKLLAYMTTWKIAETQELQQKILKIRK